ncbi:hypothetical protein WJ542_08040 [Paraburkholderia sp. B3]|uniref:hypothetical protein n=1 Tax=Paraburkholderia sp. B3 TaxID=3134791 RepID=UPI0039824D41
MKRSEMRTKVAVMLSAGAKKQDVFAELSGQGVKDRALAYLIATHVDPRRCADNKIHRRIVIAIACIQLMLAILLGGYVALNASMAVGVVVGAIGVLFAILFLRGFLTDNATIYTAFIFLSLSQLPRQLQGFSDDPVWASIGLGVGVVIIGYVWFVRHRLFPDLAIVSVRKINGKYVFSD